MKRYANILGSVFIYLSAHVGTLILFIFLDLFSPLLIHSVVDLAKKPPGFDFVTSVASSYLYILFIPSVVLWCLLSHHKMSFRYLVILSYNFQLFVIISVIYTFYYYVIRYQYIPLLSSL